MKIIFFFNKNVSFKTISLYMLAKILKEANKKVLIVNFDFQSHNHLQELNIDYIGLENLTIDRYDSFLKIIEEKRNLYDFLLIDSSSSLSDINLNIIKISNDVLIPIDISNDNSKEMLEILLMLKEKEEFSALFHFFLCGFNKNEISSVNSLLKIKKNLNELLSNVVINKHDFNKISDLYNNKILIGEYKNLFNSLKII